MPKEVLVLAVVGSLVLEDYVAVTRLPSRLSWGREPGMVILLSCSSPWWKWWIMGMVAILESVGKVWKVLESVAKCWKVVESGDLMIFMKAPVARTRLDGEARLELRWKDHQFNI